MTAPRIDLPVRRLIEALVDCTDPRLRDRLLVEAALTTGAARAAALWHRTPDGAWSALLERGPEELLPTRGDLLAAAAGTTLPVGRRVLLARGGEAPLALALGGIAHESQAEEPLDGLEALLVVWSLLGDGASDPLGGLPAALPGADHFADTRGGPPLAHDLRDLLSGIQTTLDVIDSSGAGLDGAELARFEDSVDRELSRAGELLSELFESGPSASGDEEDEEAEAHRASAERSPDCLPAQLLEDLAHGEAALAQSTGGQLVVEIQSAAREIEVALSGRDLGRALHNLIRGAREAEPRGKLTVELLAACGAERGLVLCVRDTGPDLPRELLESPPAGNARGLSSLAALVQCAGGHLRARNGPTGGARIELWLPGRLA